MKLAVIEDAENASAKVQRVLAANHEFQTAFEFDAALSTPIQNVSHWRSRLEAIGNLNGALALVLDLGLIGPEYWHSSVFPQERTNLQPPPASWELELIAEGSLAQTSYMFAGLWVARKAIFADNIKQLAILIASTAAEPLAHLPYLERLAVEAGRGEEGVCFDAIPSALSKSKDGETARILKKLQGMCRPLLKDSSPLDRIWDRTREWFPEEPGKGLDAGIPPHTLAEGTNLADYRSVFEDAFGLQLNPSVWESFESVNVLHEALKTLVGQTYRGNVNDAIEMRNLSIGAAYILLLLAEAQLEPNPVKRKWHNTVERFDRFPYLNARLLPDQPSNRARRAAQGIYTLFANFLQPQAKFDNTVVESVKICAQGRTMKVSFDTRWSTEKFVDKISPLHSEQGPLVGVWFSDGLPKKVLPALGAVWRSQVASNLGFGGPGSIWMHRGDLCFHSGAESSPLTQGETGPLKGAE